jgi:hypothetical protein
LGVIVIRRILLGADHQPDIVPYWRWNGVVTGEGATSEAIKAFEGVNLNVHKEGFFQIILRGPKRPLWERFLGLSERYWGPTCRIDWHAGVALVKYIDVDGGEHFSISDESNSPPLPIPKNNFPDLGMDPTRLAKRFDVARGQVLEFIYDPFKDLIGEFLTNE